MSYRRLVLIGMMGSGKTTVGRLLADKLGWLYVDNDELVQRAMGRTARELAAGGEAAVRAAELDALMLGLATAEPAIVGVAAGTILDPANREAIAAAGTVVWLRATPATLAARASGGAHRPWLEGDALAWFGQAARERAALYESVADAVVDVDGRTPAEVAAMVITRATPARVTEPDRDPALDSR